MLNPMPTLFRSKRPWRGSAKQLDMAPIAEVEEKAATPEEAPAFPVVVARPLKATIGPTQLRSVLQPRPPRQHRRTPPMDSTSSFRSGSGSGSSSGSSSSRSSTDMSCPSCDDFGSLYPADGRATLCPCDPAPEQVYSSFPSPAPSSTSTLRPGVSTPPLITPSLSPDLHAFQFPHHPSDANLLTPSLPIPSPPSPLVHEDNDDLTSLYSGGSSFNGDLTPRSPFFHPLFSASSVKRGSVSTLGGSSDAATSPEYDPRRENGISFFDVFAAVGPGSSPSSSSPLSRMPILRSEGPGPTPTLSRLAERRPTPLFLAVPHGGGLPATTPRSPKKRATPGKPLEFKLDGERRLSVVEELPSPTFGVAAIDLSPEYD